MTRTKKHSSTSVRKASVAAKRPTKNAKVKHPVVRQVKIEPVDVELVLSSRQKIKHRLGRSVTHRTPVVMDQGLLSSCSISKMGRRRIAVDILSEMSPTQHMIIRPSITSATPLAIECTLAKIVMMSQGWNKGKMLMPSMLYRSFMDYCESRGGVWDRVADECDMICSTIDDDDLVAGDAQVMQDYAETDEGIAKKKARMVSSSKAQQTKRAAAAEKKRIFDESMYESRPVANETEETAMDVDEE